MSEQEAREFLNNIKSEDKIALISHDDLDGFVSALLLNNYLKNKECSKIEIFFYTIGKTNLKDFHEKLKSFTKIIITDLALSVISYCFEELKNKKTLYIDHHQKDGFSTPDNITEYRTESKFSAARTIYELTKNSINKEKEFISILGILADEGIKNKENIELIQPLLNKYNLTLEQANQIAYNICDFLVYFENNLEKAFEILDNIKNPEDSKDLEKYIKPVKDEIDFFVKDYEKNKEEINGIKFYYFSPKFSIKSIITTIISYTNPGKSFVFATPYKNQIRLSARNQTKTMNMVKLLKAGISGLENAESGGHVPAAGGIIQKQDLEKFKENLRNYLERHEY